jgi:ATP-binding cassette subfamily B protein
MEIPFQGVRNSNMSSSLVERCKRIQTDVHTLKRIAQAVAPYTFQILLVSLITLLTTGLSTINALILKRVFDDGITNKNFTQLLIDVGIMILIPVITGIMGIWTNRLNNVIGKNFVRDFRNRLYLHLQRMPLRFFTARQIGEIQSRISNDVNGIEGATISTAIGLFSSVVQLISAIIAMLILNPLLTWISLGIVPIFLWIAIKIGNMQRKMVDKVQQSQERLSSIIYEALSVNGIMLIKIFGRQVYAQKIFETENQKLADLQISQQMIGRWFFLLIGIGFAAVSPMMYLIAGWQSISHTGPVITAGTIIAFTALQSKLYSPIGKLLNLPIDVQSALALFDRIFEYLDMPVDIEDAPHAVSLIPKETQGRLTFNKVTFTYRHNVSDMPGDLAEKKGKIDPANGEDALLSAPTLKSALEQQPELGLALEEVAFRPALKNVSFDILPGQLAALVGPSGAGKTTISYLIARLYDVDSGSVEIDGHNVKDLTLASLSELIGMVTQETYLFHASVRENLLYARPDATEEEMIAATKAAAIHDRIMELDDGYDTIVGERGYRFSGGEKQRIAIARVILKNPRILILDEATSALDTHSEHLIQAALEPLMKGRTTLVIAHRLSTILKADVILVIDKGEIVESGTHQELLALDGLYAQLYHKQFA